MSAQFTDSTARAIARATRRVQQTPYNLGSNRCYFPNGSVKDQSSFAFKKTAEDQLYIYGGWIHVNGLGSVQVPEDTHVQVTGGSKLTLGWVSLRLPVNSLTFELVFTETIPPMDGTFYFKPLHNTYLDSASGDAVWLRAYDRRHDWVLQAPIGGAG